MNWFKPLLKKTKGKKWSNAQPTKIDGHNFPSKLHASVYSTLKLMEMAGEINNIRCEVTIDLIGKLRWKADFVVFNIKRGVDEAHEAKGREFERFKTIVQVWPGAGPMDLTIWKGDAKRPFIVKTVKGKQ